MGITTKNIENFLKEIEYKKINTNTKSTYYVNSKGSQVRVDETGIINLLDNRGNNKNSSRSFTQKQIENH